MALKAVNGPISVTRLTGDCKKPDNAVVLFTWSVGAPFAQSDGSGLLRPLDSGRWESDPHAELGKLVCYHYITPAKIYSPSPFRELLKIWQDVTILS